MRMFSKKNKKEIERFNPSIGQGLASEQVQLRNRQGLNNKTKPAIGKSYLEIILTNVFNFFNVLLFIIAGFMIWSGYYSGLFFLFVIIPNMLIGLYEDIKARVLMGRLRLLTQPKAKVIRDGKEIIIGMKDLVLDDVVCLSRDSQISADCILQEGDLLVNESLLTGECVDVAKVPGDTLFSGSFVVSGQGLAKVEKVGSDSYAIHLQKAANKFKRSPSQILRSLRYLFIVIGSIVVIIGGFTALLYSLQGSFASEALAKESIKYISGSMVSMIPSGLYLLTSMALAVAVISLAKKKAQVQDFYSVEMLARTNVLCIDKTGTITDGTMSVKTFVPLGGRKKDDVAQIVSNLLKATKDNNMTANALNEYFTFELVTGVKKVLPFDSKNKYSAATFNGNKTYVLGALEFLNLSKNQAITSRVNEYASLGYRVLIVGECDGIDKNKINGSVNPIGIIVLQDHIRTDASKTFQWFKENGVAIKVISGDSAITTSEIARQAGIDGAQSFISLEGMTLEEVKEVALYYTVFGRVSPEQKEVIISTLKENKNTVAMTGDGVNDILALKRADCSIAMASGADAARNVSHIVLLNSDFSILPDVVAEGRRVINNLQRTCSLFVVKTIFAMFFSIAFLVASAIIKDPLVRYPFLTNNMYVWEIFAIGVAAFFLALEPNRELLQGSFIKNILKKAVPAAFLIIIPVALTYLCFILQKNNLLFTGIYADMDGETYLNTSEIARTICVLIYTSLSFVVLYRVCLPFDKYRKIVFACVTGVSFLALAGSCLFTYLSKTVDELLKINFLALEPINYLLAAFFIILSAGIYLIAVYFCKSWKEVKQNDKN